MAETAVPWEVTLVSRLAGEDLTNDITKVEERADYARLTATGNAKASPGRLLGIFVASASNTPSITIYDSTTTDAGRIVVGTFTPAAGTMYRFPTTNFGSAIRVVISGTVDCTVFYA